MKKSKYDIFLFLLASCLCFGDIGGALQVDRLLAILLLPFLINLIRKKDYNYIRCVTRWLVFLCIYCFISVIWSANQGESIKTAIYYPIHVLLFLEVVVFSKKANTPLLSLSKGWLIAAGISLVIALWEIYTGQHLQTSSPTNVDAVNMGGQVLTRFYASVTFFNFNSYVTFLCFTYPWLFYFLSVNSDKKGRFLISIVVILLAFIVIVANASRGGLLSCLIMFALYFLLQRNSKIKFFIIPIVLLFVYLILKYGGDLIALMIARSSGGGLVDSEDGRWGLWSQTIDIFLNTFGFGSGVGNFQFSPHNMFLEVLVQFGIVFFIALIVYYVKLLKKSLSIKNSSVAASAKMALYVMPVYSIIDSQYLLSTHFWVHMATIFVFVYYEHTQSSGNSIRQFT